MNIQSSPSQLVKTIRPYLLTALFFVPCYFLQASLNWHSYSYFLFLPAVVLAQIFFGFGIGLFAILLTAMVVTFLFIQPFYTLWLSPAQLPALALFALTAILIFGACEAVRLLIDYVAERRHNPPKPVAASPAVKPNQRAVSVDMWRGFVLCTIFINHMPGNIFEALTSRNFGLSDSAEAFVFMSGVAMALAYGRKFNAGKEAEISLALGKRAVKLYGVHVLMSLAGIAIFAAGAIHWRMPDLMAIHGRDLYVHDAGTFMLGTLTLGHQIGYFNILPLYIALIGLVPALFYLARLNIGVMLAASALLYGLARHYGWNLPSWPIAGGWFFNPFTWQFMMAIGIAVGLLLQQGRLAVSWPLFLLSGLIVAAGGFVVTNGFGLSFGVREAVYGWLDLDKTNLGLGRLVHFLGVACFIYGLGISPKLASTRLAQPLIMLGRHSLLVFFLLSLLAGAGQVVLMTGHDALWIQIALVCGGIAFLCAAAKFAEAEKAAGGPVMVRG
ncbi:OpgC domain-containing protein [Labrys neptuniae]